MKRTIVIGQEGLAESYTKMKFILHRHTLYGGLSGIAGNKSLTDFVVFRTLGLCTKYVS